MLIKDEYGGRSKVINGFGKGSASGIFRDTVSIIPFSLWHHHAAYSSFDAPEGTYRLLCKVSPNSLAIR